MSNFPQMLYRPGKGVALGETECETLVVDGEGDFAAAMLAGWFTADDILAGAHKAKPAHAPKRLVPAPKKRVRSSKAG